MIFEGADTAGFGEDAPLTAVWLKQALCALYPTDAGGWRWAEGVLARKKGLGL